MSTDKYQHRLDGLEPGNLLAFLALIGLLRSLEEAEPAWLPRVAWTVEELPMRPKLSIAVAAGKEAIATAANVGVTRLASRHEFDPYKDLKLTPKTACQKLRSAAAAADSYLADLWAAMVSDAVVRERNKTKEVEPTPLCLMFGQGHQHFLQRLSEVPQTPAPTRGPGSAISATDCLAEALFTAWSRLDATQSFRWDPHEDMRYAHRATNPADYKTKATTQHGANRLAAIGLSALTAVPCRRAGETRLDVLGGGRTPDGAFIFTWPIWRDSISFTAVRALLGHPGLDDPATRHALGVVDRQRTCRVSFGRYMNFTKGSSADTESALLGSITSTAGLHYGRR